MGSRQVGLLWWVLLSLLKYASSEWITTDTQEGKVAKISVKIFYYNFWFWIKDEASKKSVESKNAKKGMQKEFLFLPTAFQ